MLMVNINIASNSMKINASTDHSYIYGRTQVIHFDKGKQNKNNRKRNRLNYKTGGGGSIFNLKKF